MKPRNVLAVAAVIAFWVLTISAAMGKAWAVAIAAFLIAVALFAVGSLAIYVLFGGRFRDDY